MNGLGSESRSVSAQDGWPRTAESIRGALIDSLLRHVGRDPDQASHRDWFEALVFYVRGFMVDRWLKTNRLYRYGDAKIVYYLSIEFLIGRSLRNHLFNLGRIESCRDAVRGLGLDLDALYEQELDAALGNGGLGRLAACFLDSLTSLGYPAFGYGIRYNNGMFRQSIEDGRQVEYPEHWLRHGNPWEFPRPEVAHPVQFRGRVASGRNRLGEEERWVDTTAVLAIAHDLQVSGYGSDLINNIRLWSARSPTEVNLADFNQGHHLKAVRMKAESESLSRVLYPGDSSEAGRQLRLQQEHFFVSASLQDILARFKKSRQRWTAMPEKLAIQLNDTHPALAIPEMMRLLTDVEGLGWDESWTISQRVFAYTNHTLLPEALETWPVAMLEEYLPRHLEIIYRVNDEFLRDVRTRFPALERRLPEMSLIGENGDRSVRMAHLAVVGSHKVNGVSALHTGIMRQHTFADFDAVFPGRLVSKTNGITARRWLNQSNPGLADLISSRIGDGWIVRLDELERLRPFADDPSFLSAFRAVKQANKSALARQIAERLHLPVDPASLFDVHVKRIHEYKRQLLNILQVIARYNRIRRGDTAGLVPRTVIFAGKAAANYHMAKLIIKLINDVARTVNADLVAKELLRVAFIPNYGVSAAETIIPAADLSEQISTAGTEASGTGNMKLSLNGALTIGTRDGANVEIGESVGDANLFFFGLTAEEVSRWRSDGAYDPRAVCEAQPALAEVLDMVRSGYFSPDEPDRFRPIVDSLTIGGDYFMVLADFADYVQRQAEVDAAYRSPLEWDRRAVLNVAHMGPFSSDRTVKAYADEIWGLLPCALETTGNDESPPDQRPYVSATL